MEAGTNALSRTSQTDCEQGPGGSHRRESSWPVANRKLARPGHCFAECLLCRARASAHGRAVLAQAAEPPYADPHVRWCGRGEWVTTPPMPIQSRHAGTLLAAAAASRTRARSCKILHLDSPAPGACNVHCPPSNMSAKVHGRVR